MKTKFWQDDFLSVTGHFVFIIEASSNDELDNMLRNIPMWGSLDREVTALQTFSGRAEQKRKFVAPLKASN